LVPPTVPTWPPRPGADVGRSAAARWPRVAEAVPPPELTRWRTCPGSAVLSRCHVWLSVYTTRPRSPSCPGSAPHVLPALSLRARSPFGPGVSPRSISVGFWISAPRQISPVLFSLAQGPGPLPTGTVIPDPPRRVLRALMCYLLFAWRFSGRAAVLTCWVNSASLPDRHTLRSLQSPFSDTAPQFWTIALPTREKVRVLAGAPHGA